MARYKYLFECECVREVGDHTMGTSRFTKQVLCPKHRVGLRGKIWTCKHCGGETATSKMCGNCSTCPDCVKERNRKYVKTYSERVRRGWINKGGVTDAANTCDTEETQPEDPISFPELKIPTMADFPQLEDLVRRAGGNKNRVDGL